MEQNTRMDWTPGGSDTTGSKATTPSSLRGNIVLTPEQLQQIIQSAIQGAGGVAPAVPTPKAGHRKLPKYNGDKKAYPVFKFELEAALGERALGSDKDKVATIIACIEDTWSKNVVFAYIQANPYATIEDIIKYMDNQFKDPHAERNAQTALRALKQDPKEACRDLFIRAEALIFEAGYSGQKDSWKIDILSGALRRDLQNRLVTMEPKETYQEWKGQVIHIENNLVKYQQGNNRSFRSPSPQGPQADTMDWEPTQAIALTQEKGNQQDSKKNTGPRPTEQRRAKWVDREERSRRRSEGLCIRCGVKGHFIRNCPYAPARQKVQVNLAGTDPVLEDEPSEFIRESGKA